MKKAWVKSVFTVLCVLLLNVGVWGCVLFGLWEANWGWNEQFYEGAFYWKTVNEYTDMVEEAFELQTEAGEGTLSNYERTRLDELEEILKAENTNFRFSVYRVLDGELLYGNAGDREQWETEVFNTYTHNFTYWDYDNAIQKSDVQYGWVSAKISYGVTWPLVAEDDFMDSEVMHRTVDQYMPLVLALSITCIVVGLIFLILLMRVAGRRPGREEVVLNLHDRIPYDLYLAAQVFLNIFCWGGLMEEGIWYLSANEDLAGVLWVAGAGLGGSILIIAFLLTTVTRIKARTIFRNTVIWWLCKLLWRGCKAVVRGIRNTIDSLPMTRRTVVIFVLYLIGTVVSGATIILALPYQALALYLLCRWTMQWKKMRAATQEIIAGKADVKIEHEKFYPDLKEHAEQLNALGSSIDNAVNERMKSERFKSELITNVSHDLKTPLTSIINYVDLLKKEEIENPTAREYIEVLDRKSQRLKKLTEDLVEASKASTGALTVNKDDLDLVQLIRQAMGEYEEKLTNAGLSLVTNLPEGEIRIRADGRHVWRVLDNLLNNCVKYALEGTRVYLDASAWNGNAVITVKNISRNPLNIPAEQLVERFVRGDESRTTEGSGLGLSIARSLTELQGGRFSLDIDGDLFKAKVLLPLAE